MWDWRDFLPISVFDWFLLLLMASIVLVVALTGCAFRYDKETGGYAGAIGCVDVTGPGFTWKCTEQSRPILPDSQKPPTR